MTDKKTEAGFEKKLEALEELVARMEEGGMQLEQLMRSYEEGMALARSLNDELDAAQARLQVLKDGVLKDGEARNEPG